MIVCPLFSDHHPFLITTTFPAMTPYMWILFDRLAQCELKGSMANKPTLTNMTSRPTQLILSD